MTSIEDAETLCKRADLLGFGVLEVPGSASRRGYFLLTDYDVKDLKHMRIIAHVFYADGTSRVAAFDVSGARRRDDEHSSM